MRTLTGILLLGILLLSSCAKETNETDILNHVPSNPTEITEAELPKAAFDALQEVKLEMAVATAPEREELDEERNSCWYYFGIPAHYAFNQNVCGNHGTSYAHLYTGFFENYTPGTPTTPPTVVYGDPEVGFASHTNSNETLYYWFGVYDYAKGKYAYTKAGWGNISGRHTFDFTPNNWHNSRVVVWKQNNSGQYSWQLIKSVWTMPFTN